MGTGRSAAARRATTESSASGSCAGRPASTAGSASSRTYARVPRATPGPGAKKVRTVHGKNGGKISLILGCPFNRGFPHLFE